MLSRIVTCTVCLSEALTNRSELPDGWLETWYTLDVLCDSCLGRYIDRFGEEPVYLARGGDKDPELPFYDLEELHK